MTLQSELAELRAATEAREEAHRREIAAREEAHRQEALRWRQDFASYIQSIQIPGAVMPPLPATMFGPAPIDPTGSTVSIYIGLHCFHEVCVATNEIMSTLCSQCQRVRTRLLQMDVLLGGRLFRLRHTSGLRVAVFLGLHSTGPERR